MAHIYNQYTQYLKAKYGERVQKITVIGGFTCPNRDGTKGKGGCIYCNNESFGPPQHLEGLSITDQINHGIKTSLRRYKANKYIVYFQTYSNSYAPLPVLQKIYEEALAHPLVCGLAIGTRPDCVDEKLMIYLAELNQHYDITLELGLESIADNTLVKINRGHSVADFISALNLAQRHNINTGTHLIFGLPWDNSPDYPISVAKFLSKLPITFVKIHQLHVLEKTPLHEIFQTNPFPLLTYQQYLSMIVDFLSNLSPRIVIQRLFAESPPAILRAPIWDKAMSFFYQELEKKMLVKKLYQGIYYTE
ncbi:MAG: TIGR01212 family radical SAM protein [Bdellovibrionales bacterium RIFOXYC2_FULL_39_8]|nr:MAG: TIGR01212 family radical SAM protein [Bdellovibrionales bacterium RIFOXYC2_FULL_39_8]